MRDDFSIKNDSSFAQLRAKWKILLTGNPYSPNDADCNERINSIISNAEKARSNMKKTVVLIIYGPIYKAKLNPEKSPAAITG